MCFPRTCGESVRTRCEPARARSRAGCRNSRSGSMGSILSNRMDSGCVTRSDPISASRTASRFWFCQPFSDPLRPLLTFDVLNKYGIFWDFRLGGIGSGDRRFSAGSLPNLLGRVPEVRTVGWSPSSRCSWLAWSSVHGCGLRACSGIRGRCEGFGASGPRLRSASPAVGRRCGAVRSGRPSCARRGVRRRAPGASGSSCLIGYEPFLRIGSAPVSNSTSARWIGFKA